MKKTQTFVLALCATFLLLSYKKEEASAMTGIQVQWGSFSSSDNRVINGAGGSEEVLLTSDGDWTISVSDDTTPWLSVSPTSGGAGKTWVTITTSQNGKQARRGVISVNPSAKNNTFTVNQRAFVYSQHRAAFGTVTNSLVLNHSGYNFTRFHTIFPVPQTGMYQKIVKFEAEGTVKECMNNGNKYLVADLDAGSIPPSGGKVISESIEAETYSVTVDLKRIADIPEYDPESEPCRLYLGDEADELVASTHPEIVAKADELWTLAQGNLIDYARRCYEWTAMAMTYGNPYTDLHTMTELMETKKGDCANICSVYISLLRAKGIPSRHVVMLEPDKRGKHVQAEFYIPAYGWIPVDPTLKNSNPSRDYFGKHEGGYLVMSHGINSIVETPEGAPFRISLLQTYYYWCRWSKSGSQKELVHTFSKFQ